MARRPANGSGSEQVSSNGSKPSDNDDDGGNAFERFEQLTRQIISVPKDEIDRRRERAKRKPKTRSH